MTKYYMITNSDETDDIGRHYFDGFNVDESITNDFVDIGLTANYGLSYAKEDLFAFLDNDSTYIREVEVPDDATIITKERRPCFWCSDKLILKRRNPIDVNTVDKLVRDGVKLHVCDDNILLYAVNNYDVNLVKYCLDNNCNPNCSNGRPIKSSIFNGTNDITSLLLKYGATIDNDPKTIISLCVIKNNLDVLQNIISYGIDRTHIKDFVLPLASASYKNECYRYINSL